MTYDQDRRVARRTVLKAAGTGAGAAMLASAGGMAPAFLYGQDKAGAKDALVGTGEHTYRCIHDWGMASLPEGHTYGGTTHGVALDSQGLVYISHYGNPGSIFVFDPAGKFVKAMGETHRTADGKLGSGHGIEVRKEGGEEFLYLAPSESHLPFTKMNLKGEVVWNKTKADIHKESGKYPDSADGKPAAYRPTNISFNPDGGYFLGDGYGSNYIHQYDKAGQYIRTIGGTGQAAGQFRTPHGQWLDDRDGTPKMVVADRANARLQWFDMNGKHVKTLDGFLFPADIDRYKDLLVVPDLHARVTLLDKNDNVITQLGDDPEWRKQALEGFKMRGQRDRWQPGKFIHPHDARFDADGNIYVVEWVVTGRVTKLEKVG